LPGELATTLNKVPPNGDGADPKKGRNGRERESLDLAHHDDSTATWRQTVERPPHGGPDEQRFLGVVVPRRRATGFKLMAAVGALPAPLISPDVDEHAHEPRLFGRWFPGNCTRRTGGPEEGFLHEVERVIGARHETSCETVEPGPVGVEQRRQLLGLRPRQSRALDRPFAHTSLNV